MSHIFKILVDSDAFVALAKLDDSNHQKAQETLAALRDKPVEFLTSNYVLAETITVISRRVGHRQALSFIDQINHGESKFQTIWIMEALHAKAVKVFSGQTSKNTSFIDCANMAILDNQEAEVIFSFDEVYKNNGFRIITDLLQGR